MGENTKIEWCDHTANIWWGCEEVSPGCDNCYARTFARSKGKGDAWENVRYVTKSVWKGLKKWNDAAGATGVMRWVFVGSMMDIAEKPKPAYDWSGNRLEGVTTADIRERFLRLAPQLSNLLFLTLTKRPGNLLKYVPREWLSDWPPNVMPGTSPVNQETASVVVPQLLEVPARQRFLSCEPLLGAVDLSPWLTSDRPGISWVICGGESGLGARPCNIEWIRSIIRQCKAAGVPCFVKQLGSRPFMVGSGGERFDWPCGYTVKGGNTWLSLNHPKGGDPAEWPEDLRVQEFPAVAA